jgi:hypothetical protein
MSDIYLRGIGLVTDLLQDFLLLNGSDVQNMVWDYFLK